MTSNQLISLTHLLMLTRLDQVMWTWHEIIEHIAKKNKPVLIATGASTLNEVKLAMEILLKNSKDIILMQCNTKLYSL